MTRPPFGSDPSRPAAGVTAGPLSRRAVLGGGLTLGAGLLGGGLSGCSTLAAGVTGAEVAPGTVTYWNLFGGGDGVRMQTMEDTYRAGPGTPALQAATFTWGNPYYTKVSLATLGDAPPDVAVSHLTRSTNLARAGLLTEIDDDVLAVAGLQASNFNQKAWEAQQVEGRSYAIPFDTHPFVLYYNVEVCERAGLLESDGSLRPIRGTEEWESALRAAREVTGAFGASVATIADPATSWRWFQSLYSQRSGSTPWLGDGGRKLTYDRELTLDTLEQIQSLTSQGLMPTNTDYAGSQTLMFSGQSAFYLQGEWEITTAQSIEGLEFGMVPVPVLYDQPAQQGDSHTFVLPAMERSDEQLRRAMGFVRSMLDQSLTWAKGGHIPAYLPALQSVEYRALEPQSDYAGAADTVVYDAPAWYSGSGSTFENIIGAQIGLVQQGLASPATALESARSQLLTYANTPSPL